MLKILVRCGRQYWGNNGHIHYNWLMALKGVADVEISGKEYDDQDKLTDIIKHYYPDSKPDVVLFYTTRLGETLEAENVNIFKVLITIDNASNPERIERFHQRHNINLLISKYYQTYNFKIPYEILPHSIDPCIFRHYGLKKEYDISFIGNQVNRVYRDRQELIKFIIDSKKYKSYIGGGEGTEIDVNKVAHIYNQSKIGFSVPSSKNYLLSRYFEIPASYSMLLCQDTPGLKEVFKEGQHYVSFKDVNDFREKLDYYLLNGRIRKPITDAAYRHVMKYHTHQIRAREFIEILKKYI